MKTYKKGDLVEFTAQRPCTLRGCRYKKDDTIKIRLDEKWDDETGFGEGGPWGWGGYTSRFVASLGAAE